MGKIFLSGNFINKEELAVSSLIRQFGDRYSDIKTLEDMRSRMGSQDKSKLIFLPFKIYNSFSEVKYILKRGTFSPGYQFIIGGGNAENKQIFQTPREVRPSGYIHSRFYSSTRNNYQSYLGLLGLNNPIDVTGYNYLVVDWVIKSSSEVADAMMSGGGRHHGVVNECGVRLYKTIPHSLNIINTAHIPLKEISGSHAEVTSSRPILTVLDISKIQGDVYWYIKLVNSNAQNQEFKDCGVWVRDILLGK